MGSSGPHLRKVVNGRMCHAWRRRGFVEVLVFAADVASGEPVGEWEMPVALRYNLDAAAELAERQTDR